MSHWLEFLTSSQHTVTALQKVQSAPATVNHSHVYKTCTIHSRRPLQWFTLSHLRYEVLNTLSSVTCDNFNSINQSNESYTDLNRVLNNNGKLSILKSCFKHQWEGSILKYNYSFGYSPASNLNRFKIIYWLITV